MAMKGKASERHPRGVSPILVGVDKATAALTKAELKAVVALCSARISEIDRLVWDEKKPPKNTKEMLDERFKLATLRSDCHTILEAPIVAKRATYEDGVNIATCSIVA